MVKLGLKTKYLEVPAFRFRIRCLMSLAFLKVDDVVPFYEELWGQLNNADPVDLQFLIYFKRTWVGYFDSDSEQDIQPMFPIKFWNVHDRADEGLTRSNCVAEWFHNKFAHSIIGHAHPSINDFVAGLKVQLNLTKADRAQILQGRWQAIRPHYRRRNEHIAEVVARYVDPTDGVYGNGLWLVGRIAHTYLHE